MALRLLKGLMTYAYPSTKSIQGTGIKNDDWDRLL